MNFVIKPLNNKGDNRECSNHRDNSSIMIPIESKLLSIMILAWLRDAVLTILGEAQCGLEKGEDVLAKFCA